MAEFATSGGHWYGLDGTPRYTITGKNGKERNTTLRDARVMNLVPSVTTIIRCAAAPALERWKREQTLLSALTLPRRDGEPEANWLARVEQDSQETGRKAADRGTEIHGAIEMHFRGHILPDALRDFAYVARDELAARCGDQRWLPERSFAHALGYGGKTDLHSPEWLVDFKTKDEVVGSALYDEHLMQLAAYRRGLETPEARCGILFVGRVNPTALFIEASKEELAKALIMFDALLIYWQAKNGYRPCAPT